MNIVEMRRKQNALVNEAKEIHNTAVKEGRDLNTAENEKWNALNAEIEGMQKGIEREERLLAFGGQKANDELGMSEKEVKDFSVVRAVRALVNRDWRDAAFEKEVSDAVAAKRGRQPQGIYIPTDVMVRDLNATTGAGAVSTTTANSMYDILRNKLVIRQAGATFLGNLSGIVQLPKQTGAGSYYWVGEGVAPTASNQTVGQVELSPKTIGAYTDVTRQLLAQSSLDVEAFVRNDLMTVLALGIDYTALHGDSGVDADSPDGIENISGVGAPTFTASYAGIVALETEVATQNADIGRLAYITNAKMRGKLKTTAKVSSTDSVMVWNDGAAPLNGYNAFVTNTVRSNGGAGTNESFVFFGNWADLLVGTWGPIDIMVDPYSQSSTGKVRVVVFQEADVDVRHNKSFAFGSAVA